MPSVVERTRLIVGTAVRSLRTRGRATILLSSIQREASSWCIASRSSAATGCGSLDGLEADCFRLHANPKAHTSPRLRSRLLGGMLSARVACAGKATSMVGHCQHFTKHARVPTWVEVMAYVFTLCYTSGR